MKLTFKQAFKKISAQQLENIESKKYYFNAMVSILPPQATEPENFIFTFLNPAENKIIQAVVSDSSVEIKEPQAAVKPTKEKLDLSKVHVSPKKIIKKALQEFKKHNQLVSQIILALEQNLWRVTIITKALNAFIIEFDAKTGEMKNSRIENLTRVEQKE